jgi:hypothetical protein
MIHAKFTPSTAVPDRNRTLRAEFKTYKRAGSVPASMTRSDRMRIRTVTGAALIALMIPAVAYAQGGAAAGAAAGAAGGAVVGGPVGAAVGAVGGAIVGGIAEDKTPQFKAYVVEEKIPSYTYRGELVVGAELPPTGITYYEVPAEYGVTEYRYTVVNDRTVLVDTKTHKIVQIIG